MAMLVLLLALPAQMAAQECSNSQPAVAAIATAMAAAAGYGCVFGGALAWAGPQSALCIGAFAWTWVAAVTWGSSNSNCDGGGGGYGTSGGWDWNGGEGAN